MRNVIASRVATLKMRWRGAIVGGPHDFPAAIYKGTPRAGLVSLE